jgi:hypothetical protein
MTWNFNGVSITISIVTLQAIHRVACVNSVSLFQTAL